METGYVKIWRRLEKSRIFTSSEAVHVFLFLLFRASRSERRITVGMVPVDLKPGQLVTGRKAISEATGINESKVYRVLGLLKSEQQIEQQTNSKFSIISICNWSVYQQSEQQSEQQVNSNRTASEHKQELKKEENGKKEPKRVRADDDLEFFVNTLKRQHGIVCGLASAIPLNAYHRWHAAGKTVDQILAVYDMVGGYPMMSRQRLLIDMVDNPRREEVDLSQVEF